jgi:D-alanyl-D-alanine-carboxypeptidase/D-alanyl-D-alanine-endopeptidase
MRARQRLFSVLLRFGFELLVLHLMANSSCADSALLPERVAKTAQERIDAGTYQTLVFGVVADGKSQIVAFGKLGEGKSPDGDTVYEIGSITKTFTATLLADAVLSGRFTLDTPIGDLLPDFKVPERKGKKITLGEIGMHYSGLPRLPSNLLPKDAANPYVDYDIDKLKAFLTDYELPRDPGAAYEYSNLGFGLLGYALAESAHTSYQALVDTQIFRPLGMKMSGITFTDEMWAHLAPGHDQAGDAAENWDLGVLEGTGAIRSTANDMLRYLKANMGLDQTPLADAMKYAREPRKDFETNMRVGLAWMTTGQGVIWHSGWTGGYHSFIGFTADGKSGVVILTNTMNDVDDLGFATLLENAPLAPVYKAITLAGPSLDDYAGTYKLADNFLLKIWRTGDQFYAQATGQDAFKIFPSAPNEFFARVTGISMSFTRDAQGSINGLVLHQNGDHTAPKLDVTGTPPEPKETALSPVTLQDYIGQYQFSFAAILDVTLKDTQLQAQLTGQPAFPIYASAADKFFYKIVDAQLDFERDGTGKVVALVLHQNGQDLRAPRKAK